MRQHRTGWWRVNDISAGWSRRARVVGHEGRSVTYEPRMEPWVKLLTHTSDYVIPE
ncbi:hypothetical protein KCP71_00105 [Salmonella enterica subsp. enterica]|nr:hypothetical protein KCP71_00105 [Salmonella enterica subsp. enterica]